MKITSLICSSVASLEKGSSRGYHDHVTGLYMGQMEGMLNMSLTEVLLMHRTQTNLDCFSVEVERILEFIELGSGVGGRNEAQTP